MKPTTAQRFGSLGKSFASPSAAAAVIGAALLASGTTDEAETAWSPAAACLLPDVLPVAGTLLSYGGNRQLAAGGTVTHSGAFSIGANALTCGAITASGGLKLSGASPTLTASSVAFISSAGLETYNAGSRSGYYNWDATTVRSDAFIGFASSTSVSQGAGDTCFRRNSAGVIEINNGTAGQYRDLMCRIITASGAIQETPTQSSLNPTTTDIPSGKRMGWYNSTLSEFRDWVNIGGTLLKSAAYT